MVVPLVESIGNPAAPLVTADTMFRTPLAEVCSLVLALSGQCYNIAPGLLVPDKPTESCWTVAGKQGEVDMCLHSKELAERAVGRYQDS